ncbi:molybdopterin-dependent oxidoreductase [Luminiphilus sp.]|nr:molybdopterin-dependent oxidoreductase [Luminiphilus sp.]MDA9711162.1 molybdopterin-dependent oxidoreductase [Luminiphilus sp.]
MSRDEWHTSACILCELNCGIKVQTGGAHDREIVRIRGDEDHPASKGYLCQKASGLNHYQNGKDRITSPLRRRTDCSFEEIDWDTATREIMERFASIRDTHGGDKIFYYGGGGQGNHLPGAYSSATRSVLSSVYRSSALAQEKTGEFWVNGQMFGAMVRGDFHHCDVAVFLGKNPWHSHGIPRARAFLKDLSKNPTKTMIVVDPVVTETAKMADIHLRVKPGTDAWLFAAMVAMLVQNERYAQTWVADNAAGIGDIIEAFRTIPVAEYCAHAGLTVAEVERTVETIANAKGMAMFEDLGIQMNHHSTLISYLEKLVWVLCGHFGKEGAQYIPTYLQNIAGSGRNSRKSPVVGAPIISGMVPCNVIAEEILTDHPDRYRAILVESANPAHSLANTNRMREALRALELVVVIDIAMTETAREADYVLPASTQFEKWEATFFNFEFPENYFHLRKPLFAPLGNSLAEAEIHCRLLEASGDMPMELVEELLTILEQEGRTAFRDRFMAAIGEDGMVAKLSPVILYRTLGETLPENAAEGAVLWPLALNFALRDSESLARAGYSGDVFEQADQLFDAIIAGHSGVTFSKDNIETVWSRLGHDGRIQVAIPTLLEELTVLEDGPVDLTNTEFPFALSAGERRDYTANTIYRDFGWRRKDPDGSLRMSPHDAAAIGVATGDQARITTAIGSALARVEVTDRMLPGHVSLPNGFGLDNEDGTCSGIAPNELTSLDDRDKFAGTPHHKFVPAKIEAAA